MAPLIRPTAGPESADRRRTVQRLLALSALAMAGAGAAAPRAGGSATVAAASDLKFALDELVALARQRNAMDVTLVLGSSGNLATQFSRGAPYHLFLSADEAMVFRLAEAGLTADRGQPYAIGRIGLFVPRGSPLQADGSLRDLGTALTDGRLRRFAIANPQHAPYGMRAREALQHAGLWARIQPHLVLGDNVSQAAQFAAQGSTQGGIIAQSLALAPGLREAGRFALIPDAWHQPLNQRMVLRRDPPPAAVAFRDLVLSTEGRAVLARHGFVLPQG